MNREEFESEALALMNSGLNCAECMLLAATRRLLPGTAGTNGPVPRIATCFGGGVGRSFTDICGALSGAVMAVSLAYGRDEPGLPTDRAQTLAAELRRRFIKAHGASSCAQLLEAFGPQEDMADCRRLTAATAGMLWDIMEEAKAQDRG
jgi:C_GCAxxG_C_C family probable redox protein